MFLWESCKRVRGLKIHRRSGRVIRALQSETLERLEDELVQNLSENNDLDTSEQVQNRCENLFVMQGVKLPKSPQQWQELTIFLKRHF